MNLKEQIAEYQKHLGLLEQFDEAFGERLPDGMGDYILHSFSGPEYAIYLSHRTDADREKALCAVGEILGPDGWESEFSQTYSSFTWSRLINGVRIIIQGAKVVPPPVKSRVHPSEFPVLLKDRAGESSITAPEVPEMK